MSLDILKILIFLFPLVISPPSCQDHSNFCFYCNTLTNLCSMCEFPEIMIPDKNGGCISTKKCISGKNNCNECDTNGELCKSCDENYYPDENGGCAYSNECEISDMGECLKCKEGFILIGKELKICKSLSIDSFKNCHKINYETGYCNICDEGYYLTSKDHKCVTVENCKESVFGNCVSCNSGYYLNKKEDKCILQTGDFYYCKQSLDGKKCEICEDNYYLDENDFCVITQFCSESENSICKKCIPGYHLSNNYGPKVCTNTDNCNTADQYTSICTSCINEYYLDLKDYKCKSNLEDGPFKYCQFVENDSCKRCDNSHHLAEDFKCSESYFCSEAENGKCLKCPKNYYLSHDNICTEVEKCMYTEYNSCIECEDGYYYHKYNRTCLEMKDQFLNCKSSCYENPDECCICKKDFYLFKNDSLCYDNTKEEPYMKCTIVGNDGSCLDCEDGYFLGIEDNKCSNVEFCLKVGNDNKCIECDIFYCLDIKNQRCVDNDRLSEMNDKIHISCNRTNEEGTACAQCINGYELNEEGLCVDIDICEEKENGKCKKCKDIISPNEYEYCANEIFGCLESVADNCLRCDNLTDLYQCTECKAGYYYSKVYNLCRNYLK